MDQQQFDTQRERAVIGFAKRARRVILTNLIAVLTPLNPLRPTRTRANRNATS